MLVPAPVVTPPRSRTQRAAPRDGRLTTWEGVTRSRSPTTRTARRRRQLRRPRPRVLPRPPPPAPGRSTGRCPRSGADLQGGPGGPWHTLSQAHRGPHPDIRHRQRTGHRPFQLLRLIVLAAGESKQTSIWLFLFLATCRLFLAGGAASRRLAWRLFLAGGESATGLAVPGSCSLRGQMYIITTHLSMPFC
jgi:hypothetical protein